MRRECPSTRRASAGTRSPVSRRRTSPGTSSRAGISRTPPSRLTFTTGAARRDSAAIAFSARYSWVKPSSAFRRTMATIATVSTRSPSSAETTAAARRTATIVEANWERKMRPGRSGGPSGSSLGPLARRRDAASAPVSPDPGSVRSSRTTSAISRRCQSLMVRVLYRLRRARYERAETRRARIVPFAEGPDTGGETKKGSRRSPFPNDPFSPGVSAYSFPTRTNAMTSA